MGKRWPEVYVRVQRTRTQRGTAGSESIDSGSVMTDIKDNTYVSTLQNAGNVPGNASQALADPTWAWLYEAWAQEPRVDYVTQFMAQLARMTVDPNVSYNQLRMEAYTGQRVELYSSRTNQAFDLFNEDDSRTSLRADAVKYADAQWERFTRFVNQSLGQDTGDDNLDWGAIRAEIDAVNQPTLKNLKPGESESFWQRGDVVLIGSGHKEFHYELVGSKDSPTGTVQMDKKGGFLDTGRILAYNSSDPAGFDQAIARFSKKKVVHGDDYQLEEEEDDDEGGQRMNTAEMWANFDGNADYVAQIMSQELGTTLTWTGAGWMAARSAMGQGVAHQIDTWPELKEAIYAADKSDSEVWARVNQIIATQD
jgi:hypothetical protein